MLKKKDNSTFEQKVDDRLRVLGRLNSEPVVCETHGGFGRLFTRVYHDVSRGIVFDKDAAKADALSVQRPTWRVYHGDAQVWLAAGVGRDLSANIIDIDPYGSPWECLDAYLASRRVDRELWIVANDGLRQSLMLGIGWHVGVLAPVVQRRGNNLFSVYLDVCEEMLADRAKKASAKLARFSGYYCGHGKRMTHWIAMLRPLASGTP